MNSNTCIKLDKQLLRYLWFYCVYSLLEAMAEAVSAVENESDYSSKESEYDTEELAQLGALNLSESDN